MQSKNYTVTKILITVIITILIFGLLFWEYFHGGVSVHHLLHKKELPAISNWWGGLCLPVLTWFLLGRIEKRLELVKYQTKDPQFKLIGLSFLGLIFGLSIAISFTNGYKPFLDNIPYIFLLLSLLFPIYYAEFILSFILGMTYTFGAILPTIFISIIGLLGFLIYRFIRPVILKITKLFNK